jgi:hypothetical protein
VKFLLFGAVAINVAASIYLMLIAPIMITGWNNTAFHADAAILVAALLVTGTGGTIVGFIWRDTRTRTALWVAGSGRDRDARVCLDDDGLTPRVHHLHDDTAVGVTLQLNVLLPSVE